MKLFNSLTKKAEELSPLDEKTVRIYSCGPTVYDHIHIGNLSSFIMTDTLRRIVSASGLNVKHVMNITDIDDKMIARSQQEFSDSEPLEALKQLSDKYAEVFMSDMKTVGNDIEKITFPNATDNIDAMQKIITELYKSGIAYLADDGVYFSIDAYEKSGKKYGQLSSVTVQSTANERVHNDEYDKDSAHDFALWKTQKPGEPSWEFELDGKIINGRPGWHIECSAMSGNELGVPFDIHTGGVDLIFPHHENEIAQSTALSENPTLANIFVHNEHILVDGKKMSKSLNNFFTLSDITKKGFSPIAFRLLVLQSHYRNQVHFSWDNLEAAQNRLKGYQAMADLRFQTIERNRQSTQAKMLKDATTSIIQELFNDMNTPGALEKLSAVEAVVAETLVSGEDVEVFELFLSKLDDVLGLELGKSEDISDDQKDLLLQREEARLAKDWQSADDIRKQLAEHGLSVRDTEYGSIWYRN